MELMTIKTLLFGTPLRVPPKRRRMARWAVLGLLAPGCVLDSDDLCGPNQVIWGDDQRCVCAEGTAYTPEGCVACGENEMASPAGCLCVAGFARPAADQACAPIPAGIGQTCTTDTDCLNPDFARCQVDGANPGYCTSTGCGSRADCPSGYFCNTGASPTYCRPPEGAGRPCTGPADCAGTDAIFCDTFVSQTCLVQDCNLAPDDCIAGSECCDLTNFGIPLNLCIAAGACIR